MVLLTITPSVLEGLKLRAEQHDESAPSTVGQEPLPSNPQLGDAISHGQLVDLWKTLTAQGRKDYSLENLLKGSRVYVPPAPPKPEPSNEYKALMARLRRQEEERAYERMLNPAPPMESFSQRFPSPSSMKYAFAEANRPTRDTDIGDDDVTYNDVHRQMMLILNFVVSILGVGATLWVLARWWPTPARLFLAMGGSILVGIAEFAVYSGYIWHLSEAKKKDKTVHEVKEVMQTWVVGQDAGDEKEAISIDTSEATGENVVRRRRKEMT